MILAESNPTSPRVLVTGSSRLVGDADACTTFELLFEKIPPNVKVFVSMVNVPMDYDGSEAKIINEPSDPVAACGKLLLRGVEYCEVHVNGFRSVRWELLNRGNKIKATIKVLVVLLIDRNEVSHVELVKCKYKVYGNLTTWRLPPSASQASSKFRIPRFWVGGTQNVECEYWNYGLGADLSG